MEQPNDYQHVFQGPGGSVSIFSGPALDDLRTEAAALGINLDELWKRMVAKAERVELRGLS